MTFICGQCDHFKEKKCYRNPLSPFITDTMQTACNEFKYPDDMKTDHEKQSYIEFDGFGLYTNDDGTLLVNKKGRAHD